VGLDVIFADASARPGAFHFVDVDAQFSRQSPDTGRGWNGLTMFGARNFAQLQRHGEGGRRQLRLIGWQRLFFGFALGTNRGLECQARSVLSGNMFDGAGLLLRRFGCGCAALQREDHLPDFDFFAFFYFDFFDHATHRGRNFHDRFVGFQLHHGLAFRDFGSRGDHQPNQIALRYIFAKLGQGELAGAGLGRSLDRRSPIAACRLRRRRCARWSRRNAGRGLWLCGACGRRCCDRRGWRSLRGWHRRRLGRNSIVDGENNLADFNLVAFFNTDFLNGAAD